MARVHIEESKCTGCGRCVEICPPDVLRASPDGTVAVVAYPDDCDGCRLCFEECPETCIAIDDSEKTPGTMSLYDVLGMDDTWDTPGKN